MLKFNVSNLYNKGGIILSILAASTISASAQGVNAGQTLQDIAAEQAYKNKALKREVQPISYWVDSSALRVRDNPVAGTIVGSLEYGQKIMAYSQYENWVRVSKAGQKEQWVNSDFLSNSRLSWASYNRTSPSRSSDVVSVRIKDPSDRKNRIFGVRVKKSETENVLITTRHDNGPDVFFQNRFVSCNDHQPLGVRLVGEGLTFLGAQNDIRNLAVDLQSSEKIEDRADNSAEIAISEFACKVHDF